MTLSIMIIFTSAQPYDGQLGYDSDDYFDDAGENVDYLGRETRILRPHAQKKLYDGENNDLYDRETRILRPHAGKRFSRLGLRETRILRPHAQKKISQWLRRQ